MKSINKYVVILFSLLILIQVQGQPGDTVSVLLSRCWKLTYSAPDSALALAHRARHLAGTAGEPTQLARSNLLIGIVYDVKARYDSAMLFHHKALKTAQEVNDTALIAGSLSNIGLTFWHVGSYYKALENFFASLGYFESMPQGNPNIASVYNNIGLIYSELKEYGKSIGYFRKAGEIYRSNSDTLGLGAVLTNMAVHYSKTDKPLQALDLIDSAIAVKRYGDDIYGLAIAYNEKAYIQLNSGAHDEAYASILQSLQYSRKIADQSAQAASYHMLQRFFRNRGNYSRAIRYNNMALEIARKIEDRKLIMENFLNLSEIYREQNDFEKSLHYYQLYSKMKDSLVDQHQLNNIYTIEFQHQLEKQQGESAKLQEKQEIQSLKIERQELMLSKRNLQMILIAGAFLVVLLFVYIRYMRSQHKYKREMVVTLMQQKSRQAKKIIDAELNERKRISQELHDSLGQLLSLMKMNLSKQLEKMNSQQPLVGKKTDEALVLVDQAISELRNITQNLSPLMLKEKGLQTALRDMIQRLKKVSGIEIMLEVHDLDKLEDELIESTVFSVVQETLNNAVKHAECSRIDVQVICGESEITVMVEDNGKGFHDEEIQKGLGLKQIKTKVSNLEGQVEIDSVKNRGTIITVEIPTHKIFEI